MLERIRQLFDAEFAAWGITLPAGDVAGRGRGSIARGGWSINYRFGVEDGVEYLEYFASHRMTNDTLNRIYESGRAEVVGYCQEFYAANDPQAEREYTAHNRAFYEEVKSRGLLEP